jgi:hypothetical protein
VFAIVDESRTRCLKLVWPYSLKTLVKKGWEAKSTVVEGETQRCHGTTVNLVQYKGTEHPVCSYTRPPHRSPLRSCLRQPTSAATASTLTSCKITIFEAGQSFEVDSHTGRYTVQKLIPYVRDVMFVTRTCLASNLRVCSADNLKSRTRKE